MNYPGLALLVFAIASALSALPVTARGAGNLLLNPGFELADGDGPAFWEARTPSEAVREMTWSATVARSGNHSLAITNLRQTQSRWRTGHLSDILLTPGGRCELSGWVKTSQVVGEALLRLYFVAADGKILAQPGSPTLRADCDWTQLKLPFTVPTAPSAAMVYLELSGTGQAWFDDVVLTGERSGQRLLAPAAPQVFPPDSFWSMEGYVRAQREGRQVLELPPTVPAGQALLYFTGETACYDIIVQALDEPDGASTLRAQVNGRDIGSRTFDAVTTGTADVLTEWTLPGVDLQRNSKLILFGHAESGEYCRIAGVSFRRVAAYSGELQSPAQLPPPPSLLVYQDPGAQSAARSMMYGFLETHGTRPRREQRERELGALKTPPDWAARQRHVRDHLADYWGPFPPKTPLNARVVGVLDRPAMTIEKVIFESRPGYYVTANCYRPKGRAFPLPGVIFVCGHSEEGKGYHLYHECCLGLALKGYVVLAIDPTGQGERSEYFDPVTLKHLVPLTVAQHHQLGRPSFLVGMTLGGYRTWDAIRGVDYLVSRPEVDAGRIAAVGNSGGGQMALLVTAADERVAVCAAAHPGGSMENTYLNGMTLSDRDILSLIAPRPCRFIVGDKSGETGHALKVEDMKRFYRGLGMDEGRCELKWVEGVHNMERPKRVAAYEWLNRWFDRQAEGSEEPDLAPHALTAPELWCTETGFTLKSLGGESGQSLNARRMRELLPPRTVPAGREVAQQQADQLRAAVAARLRLRVPATRDVPPARRRTLTAAEVSAELLVIDSEPDIRVPAVLLRPTTPRPGAPTIVHVAERGKPTRYDQPSLPLALCQAGLPVLTIDVRGVGETDTQRRIYARTAAGYSQEGFSRDSQAIEAYATIGRSMVGMQAFDVIRAADYVRSRPELADHPPVVVGEGLGGLWALIAAAFDPHLTRTVAVRSLLSYRMLVESKYYEMQGYFWVPEVLRDFDIPELSVLAAPRETVWLDPLDAMGNRVDAPGYASHTQWAAAACQALDGRVTRADADGPDLDATTRALLKILGASRDD